MENINGETGRITRELRFLDSYRFMASSLEKLVANVPDKSMHIMCIKYLYTDMIRINRTMRVVENVVPQGESEKGQRVNVSYIHP